MLPPVIAPTQVVVIPIAQHKEGVLEAAAGLRDRLTAAGIRVSMDDSDQSAGWKFAQYEMKGVPLRVEIGPKDMEKGQCCIARRDTGEKTFVPLTELESAVQQLLQDVHDNLYAMAEKNLEKADENLRYATLGFEEGVIPASNVLEAHTAWLSAQSEKIDAQIDVKLTEIYLKKATGSLNIEN